ncbi:unnamed protein product [Alopecurus aequalis]
MPVWVRKEIDRLRRAWLWRGEESCHGGHCKVAWSRICRPQELGGLGIVDLERFGSALRLKWLWAERTVLTKPWSGMPVPCSLADRRMFAVASLVRLGDGRTARFWFDSWTPEGAPFLAFPDLFAASQRKHRVVAAAIADRRWVLDLRGRVTTDMLPSFVKLWLAVEGTQLLGGVEDAFSWRCTESGSFSWPNSYFCPLFMRNLETAEHLLVECPWSRSLWDTVAACFGLASFRPGLWPDPPLPSLPGWLATLSADLGAASKKAKSLALLVIWAIWRERNARIFRASSLTPSAAAQLVADDASSWAMAGCRHLRCRE